MSKRFTATEKWDKAWYRKLSPTMKCLWQFICDRCDQSGVLDMDWDLASFQIGAEVSVKDLVVFEGRVHPLNACTLWIPSFVEFQYGTLSPSCPAHKPVLRSIEKHFPKGYPIGYEYPIKYLQEKEKEKDKEKEEEEETEKGGKKTKTWTPTAHQLEVGSWFNRRPTTEWNKKEKAAWEQVESSFEFAGDDWEALRWYYTKSGCQYLRTDLGTLLNNWNGEIDRAKKYNPDAK